MKKIKRLNRVDKVIFEAQKEAFESITPPDFIEVETKNNEIVLKLKKIKKK